jgi:lipopolysaccharide/colanic/teichoic acid biosynthesis glycosyltransferase
MKYDEEGNLNSEFVKLNERGEGPLFKTKNDPRVTKVGRFIRKTRLDEFPQLINVLKGEMSLVGPRPHEPEEVAKYEKHHKKLLTIKPGCTGMAQISGSSDLDFEKEAKLDIYYIENWSMFLDFIIIIKTMFMYLRGDKSAC